MSDDIRNILINNGFEEFIPVFEENNLDKEILSELTEADYRKLGVSDEAVDKIMKLFSRNSSDDTKFSEVVPAKDEHEIIDSKGGPKTSLLSDSLITKLQDNGLSEYITIFERERLYSEELLRDLNQSDFEKLGVTFIGDQKKMLKLFSEQNNLPQAVVNEVVPYYEVDKKEENPESPPQVIINNATDLKGSGISAGISGVLGGVIGALAVIVIILIILSNESWHL
jgi:hypothetical protein